MTPPPTLPVEHKKKDSHKFKPIFPMEQDKTSKTYINQLIAPILDKVLQETKNDSMTTTSSFNFLWQPHNYRLKIPLYSVYKKTIAPHKSAIKMNFTERTRKYTKKNYKGYTIELNPTCLVIIFSSKTWYKLSGTMPEINYKLDFIINKIKEESMSIAKEVGLKLNLNALYEKWSWSRNEDKIKGDEFLDKVPKKLIIHDTTFKKVYPDYTEFLSPFYLKNYINNRAIDMVAPQIVESINNNTKQLNDWTKAVKLEIKNKKLHMKVLNDMSLTLNSINNNLLRLKYQGKELSGLERMLL